MKTTTTAYTEYDQQAKHFLSSNGIKFRATLSDSKTPAWSDNGKHGHHYRVTLSKPAARLTFDFWGSIADAGKLAPACKRLQDMQLQMQNTEPHLRINWECELAERQQAVAALHPSPYDVLACISSDVHTPETFKDFCADYGYESDSIKALQTFRRCLAFAKRLKAFFTEAELEQLSEIQ